jgi:hypothetical protein
MFDPAALGTLIIGLNAERTEAQSHRRRRQITAPRRTLGLRIALANRLRRAAAALDRPPVHEVANP